MDPTRQANLKLLRAAESGTEREVELALNDANVDKNCRETTGYQLTALHRAVQSNVKVAGVLIRDEEVKLNLTDKLGQTILHFAWSGCVDEVVYSGRKADAEWDGPDNIGQTPLLFHARRVQKDSVCALLDLRDPAVSMSKRTIDGFTALHQVVEHDPSGFPTWYKRVGPSLEDRCKLVGILLDGWKERARERREEDYREILQLDVLEFVNALNRSALHYNIAGCVAPWDKLLSNWFTDQQRREEEKLTHEDRDLQWDVMELFVNAKDVLHRSALHYIAEEGCVPLLEKLLNWFTDEPTLSLIGVNYTDFHGFAPLHLAVRRGHTDMVRRLLQLRMINPNVGRGIQKASNPPHLEKYEQDHKEICRPDLSSKAPAEQYSGGNLTPLHFAAIDGNTEITRLLLDTNLNINVLPAERDLTGRSPLNYSILKRDFQVAASLLMYGTTITPMSNDVRWEMFDEVLCLAEGPDDKETANFLLGSIVDSTERVDNRETDFGTDHHKLLITVAARENRHQIIPHVWKWQPEVNANFQSEWTPRLGQHPSKHLLAARTPLQFAVSQGHVKAVKALLTHKPLDANAKDSKDRIPLQIATEVHNEASDEQMKKKMKEIENLLMEREEVKDLVERLYRDRQVFVDAANALLVGAALVASVAFTAWLQPPRGYTSGVVAVEGHPILKAFVVFNTFAFLFAIAIILAGAYAAMPSLQHCFIGEVVKSVRTALIWALIFLWFSVFCVLGAFASAGFAVLPPPPDRS